MSFKYTANNLKKLEQILEEARYILRYEKGNFNSGYCLLEEKRIVVVNRFLNLEGKINVILELLPDLKMDLEELSPEMANFYQLAIKSIVV